MRALSIRQPYAELILRGIKTVEYRSRPTRIVGERFWIYAPRKLAAGNLAVDSRRSAGDARAWSAELVLPGDDDAALPWMIELANALRLFREPLPTGVIVGSAIIEKVEPGDGASGGMFRWHLAGVERASRLRKPTRHPQPAWFRPF